MASKAARSTGNAPANNPDALQKLNSVLQAESQSSSPAPEGGASEPGTSAEQADLPAGHLPVASAPRRDGTRIPFGKQAQRLAYPTRDGFVGYWFNDDNDRLERAIQAGWEFVRDRKTGKPVSRPVGKRGDGTPGGMLAYRMEIPKELYDQDFADAQKRVDDIMGPIAAGRHGAKDGDNRYVPQHTPINFESKTRLV